MFLIIILKSFIHQPYNKYAMDLHIVELNLKIQSSIINKGAAYGPRHKDFACLWVLDLAIPIGPGTDLN